MAEFESEAEARGVLPWENDDEQEFVVESGAPSFTLRLTRRQKLLRGGVALLVVVAAAFVLLGGPSATASLLDSPHQPVAAAARIPMAHVGQLAAISLPPGSATIPTLHIGPAAGGPGAAYACWTSPVVGVGGVTAGILHVTALTAGSLRWRAVSPPVTHATRCDIVADAVKPQAALLSVLTRPGDGAVCLLPDLYLTTDGGATWQKASLPDSHLHVCSVNLDLEDGRIYATSDVPLLPTQSGAPNVFGRLIVSTDRGRTWRAADGALGSAASITLAGIRPGGRLLVVVSSPVHPGISVLWESGDDGISWRSLGTLPGTYAQVYVSQNPADTASGGWGRLYVRTQAPAQSDGGGGPHTYYATGYPGSGWRVVPSLPVAPINRGGGSVDALDAGVGPGGLLYVTQVIAGLNDRAFTPPRTVWIWDPRQSRWLLSPVGLPANTLAQGMSWTATTMYLWLIIVHQGIPPTVQIARLALTSRATSVVTR